MILIQLTKDDYWSISGLLASETGYWERVENEGALKGLALRWRNISSRFNPIASDESTILRSPFCPFCTAEMALEENIPDQAGEMTVIWACDRCEHVMELRTRNRGEE